MAAGGVITYAGVDALNVTLGVGADTLTVADTASAATTTVRGGESGDTGRADAGLASRHHRDPVEQATFAHPTSSSQPGDGSGPKAGGTISLAERFHE